MLEGIICPKCEASLEEVDLKDSLVCVNCKTDLRDRTYLDFLEHLMTNGIVENLDFFDADIYSVDVEDLDQTEEEEGDPSQYEKRKDLFNIYENEVIHNNKQDEENTKDYTEFEGIEEDWEDFNEREFSGKNNNKG